MLIGTENFSEAWILKTEVDQNSAKQLTAEKGGSDVKEDGH